MIVGNIRYFATYSVSQTAISQLQIGPPRRMAQEHILQALRGLGNVTVQSGGVIVEAHSGLINNTVQVSIAANISGNGVSARTIDAAVAEGLRRSGWGHVQATSLVPIDDSLSAYWVIGSNPIVGDFRSASRAISRGLTGDSAAPPPAVLPGTTIEQSSVPNRQGISGSVSAPGIAEALARGIQSTTGVSPTTVKVGLAIAAIVAIGYTVRSFK